MTGWGPSNFGMTSLGSRNKVKGNFFGFFRGLEQLSSLFWRRLMAISELGVIQLRFPFVGVEIFTIFQFLWHSFGSRYARKPIKGSKDSDDSIVSKKNLRDKIGSLDWSAGTQKLGQKNRNDTPICDVPPQRNSNPKRKFFFNLT